MDGTAEYAKQCEKAAEIQSIWRASNLDMLPSYCWSKAIERVRIVIWAPDSLTRTIGTQSDSIQVGIERHKPQLNSYTLESRDESIWLPRQDQLQEMLPFAVGTFEDNFWSELSRLNKWAFSEKFVKYIPTSMEQLWLAFVMKEKYNKHWTGEEWEVTSEKMAR